LGDVIDTSPLRKIDLKSGLEMEIYESDFAFKYALKVHGEKLKKASWYMT
jgi:hypothetical protein